MYRLNRTFVFLFHNIIMYVSIESLSFATTAGSRKEIRDNHNNS